MSARYVVLIIANANPNEQLLAREVFGPQTEICALTTSGNPEVGLSSLQNYCPIPLELVHTIESATRTDDLERTLSIRYNAQRIRPHSFWYYLTPADIAFIRTIHRDNLMRITGIIKRQLAPPPQVNGKPIGDAITDMLAQCDYMLKELTI